MGGGKMGKVSVAVWATAAERDRGVYGRRKVQLVGGEWADAEDFSVLLCGMRLGTMPGTARAPGRHQLCALVTPTGSAWLQRLL